MSAERASGSSRVLPPRHVLVGNGDDQVTMASIDGETISSGKMADWQAGLQHLHATAQKTEVLVHQIKYLMEACKKWRSMNDAWAEEIAILATNQPTELALFVVMKPEKEIDIQVRRDVADLGLIIGGALKVRSEARVMTERPNEHTLIVS